MKKKVIIIIICLLLLCVVGFCKCVSDLDKPCSSFGFDGVRGNLIYHWDEELPVSGDMKYEIDDLGGFPIDGVTFAVIDYQDAVLEDRYEEWVKSKDWTELDREDIEFLKEVLKSLTVEEEYRPDYSKVEVYKRTKSDGLDDLYILHEKGTKKIYVLEWLI